MTDDQRRPGLAARLDHRPPSGSHRGAVDAVLAGFVLLLGALTVFPIVVGLVNRRSDIGGMLVWGALELTVIVAFATWLHRRPERLARPAQRIDPAHIAWAAALAMPLAGMIAMSPDAGYATIALFFVVLWLLPLGWGTATTLLLALLVIAGQLVHHGFSLGAVAGPAISAFVTIGIMLSTRAMVVSNDRNAALIVELRAAQTDLAAAEREQGRLAERTRLGRELHDTVAQHLSSIGMLLGAAERAEAPEAAEHVARARTVAADALAQTRAFIQDLAPPQLEGASLASALRRLADDAASTRPDAPAARASFEVRGAPRAAPMTVEAALLRVAQEAIANARRHGRATELELVLDYADDDSLVLEVHDNGTGFDADAWFDLPARADGTGFGLTGMRGRLEALGGFVAVVSDPGEGALVRAQAPLPRPAAPASSAPAANDPGGPGDSRDARDPAAPPAPNPTPTPKEPA
ncbi:MAG: sensor histidine kinase [Microbacteriaceae bacterium]|nr:sensor histidine kinase [Microbacteriaceae bacterium]